MSETINMSTGQSMSEGISFVADISSGPRPFELNEEIRIHLRALFNTLKARMMNLAETSAPETRQCNAVKGLMKDFLNEAYYGSLHMVDEILDQRGLLDRRLSSGPIQGLDAKGLGDLQVD